MLAVGAHTDDIELGCGATLSRYMREGAEVATVAFSRAELSRPAGTADDVLEREYRAAMAELGVAPDRVHCLTVPVRTFDEHRQTILQKLIELRREFNPDLILTMSSTDTHQDHSVVHSESVRAFKMRRLLGYHAPWNERQMITNYFVTVTQADVEKKVSMLQQYRTQHDLGRDYVQPVALESTLRFYGQQAGVEFAEAFEVLSFVS